MIIQHGSNILIIKNIFYTSFINIVTLSNIDRQFVFNYIIKIKIGDKYYIKKKYYNYTLERFIKKIKKYNCLNKENIYNIHFKYIIIKSKQRIQAINNHGAT